MDPIMPTPVTTSTGGDSRAASDRMTAAGDFQNFLVLLTAQLRNQDPMDPLDSTQFVAQLASFSTVEQLVGTNERLDAISEALVGSEFGRFSDWIGRDVSVANGLFTATGEGISFPVGTVQGAERIEAVVSTPDGEVRRRFTVVAEDGQARWDGLSDAGKPVNGQTLRIDLYYLRGEEILREQRAEIFGRVVGLTSSSGGTLLQLDDGRRIDPADVSALHEPGA